MSARGVTTAARALGIAALLGLTALPHGEVHGQATSCPQTSPASQWSGVQLDDLSRSGTRFDALQSRLQLTRGAGTFRIAQLGINDDSVFAAAGDFNRDGWTDFVGGGETSGWVRVYVNKTGDHPTTNWGDPTWVRTPDFQMGRQLLAPSAVTQRRSLIAADFNGDGWTDIMRVVAEPNEHPFEVVLWLNAASNDHFGYPNFLPAYDVMASGSYPADFGVINWTGRNIIPVDYNGDRRMDILVGSSSDGGTVRIFLNSCTLQNPPPALPPDVPLPCTDAPKLVRSGAVATGIGFGSTTGALPVFDFVDFDRDGWRDLIVGSPNCCSQSDLRLRIWKGVDGGGVEATPSQSVTFAGGAVSVLAADFSLDGLPDLIVGTEDKQFGVNQGGNSYYWINNGTGTPFTGPPSQQINTRGNLSTDFDVGIAFDYDHDPDNTPDVMFADGNQSVSFYIMSNRVSNQFVSCGEAASDVIDLGTLSDEEMVVTGARIEASYAANGGTVQMYLSNETPANWVQATPCPDGSGDLCAGFPHATGREVRWKVVMCSNAAHTASPTLTSASVTFDYTRAREHYRAGVVTVDGVAYVGAFRQPGDRGHFYAINARLDQQYWDVADKLDDPSHPGRNIFTTAADGVTRLEFDTPSNTVTPELRAAMGAADDTQAVAVVSWARSARFGLGIPSIPSSKLGAVETSTPAVLGVPGLPSWYTFANSDDRARVDSFIASQQDRTPLVLFGAKDGMIHAVRSPTRAGAILQSTSGQEAWAFVPQKVAAGMIQDYTQSVGGPLTIRSYPDGSPTLADYRRSDGTMGTAAIVSGGNGGQSLVALDVTNTVGAPATPTAGPTPLWAATPGESLAGQGLSKPAVARTLIGGAERFLVIAATGLAVDNPTPPYDKGRIVSAYDLASGELVWQFRARCPVTSDVTLFETDDELETGAPQLDGYIDRAVFADRCGYVYKLNPAKDLNGGWNGNAGLGAIPVDPTDGVAMYALFSTGGTTGALGSQSPIAGTLAARTDVSTRMVLFFGTGGLESHPVTQANEFYAIYADTGAIRSKIAGACTSGVCEKFYGGVVVTAEQVIVTRTSDPAIGTAACDTGRTVVQSVELDANTDGEFTEDFNVIINSAVVGALYGDAGAVYFATLAGDVSRIGTPRASEAGGDSDNPGSIPITGPPEGSGSGGGLGFVDPVIILGWRQVL